MSRSRSRRAMLARRRRRRRRLISAGLLLAAGLAALVVLLARGHGAPTHRAVRPATPPGTATSPAPLAPALSASGLPLGHPPLVLDLRARPAVDPHFGREPRAGLLFDLDSGRVLWQRAPEQRLPIASLTKMMTGLLVAQDAPPHARVRITREALAYQGSGVGVLPGGRLVDLTTLLYGLMLPSGNDAAIALAQHIAGSVPRFVARMNLRAAQLGLPCTRYTSPSGFQDAGNFSCAADLAVLAHADLAVRRLARVVRTRSISLPLPIKSGRVFLYNNNPLVLARYPGIDGLKTGFTTAAGPCLVATAQRGNRRLGVVLLHSPNPAAQAQRLLDEGFALR